LNYALVRIVPPEGVEIEPNRRPFIVVDRAPATVRESGASRRTAKSASRMQAGHPCYFIGFLPEPMPGQTIERIALR